MVQEICYSFCRVSRIERYKFVVLIGFLLFGGKIKASEAFDTSTFDTLRLGDEITSDMLEQFRALQAILNQPISLGLLVKGGEGSAGPPGSPGKTGERGTVGDEGPVGEKGSSGLEGRFGKTGSPGPPGAPAVNYANYRRDHGVNDDQSYINKQQQNYNTDQSLSMKTQVICEGNRLWIGCNQNEKINITNAFWGRDDFITCSQDAPSSHSIRQYSLNNNDHELMKIKEICDWRPSCEFYATRLFLDDVTDSQVYKYLRVVYECVPKVYDEGSFGEHREN